MIKHLLTPQKTLIGLVLALAFAIAPTMITRAEPVTNWNAGYILSDAMMTHSQSMSVNDIQNFLNSKVPSCDTQGTKSYTFNGVTKTGAQWAQYWYGPGSKNPNPSWASPPFTCLKDYNQNGISAAQIIYNAAQNNGINPAVLIVLLQKEQSLVTDTWPSGLQYRSATGYGCPDNGTCDSQYYGLTNQLNKAAYMFRSIMNRNPNWYSPYVVGNNFIKWSPAAGCGGSNVYIQNWATAALYDYTPYQPNQSALNAGWGTGDGCGAYGNRNFFLYFSSWFGSPTAETGPYAIKAFYDNIGGTGSVLGASTSQVFCGLYNRGCYQNYQNGNIYWSPATGAHYVLPTMQSRWGNFGYENGKLGYPTSDTICGLPNNGCYQGFQNSSAMYSTPATGTRIIGGAIRAKWGSLGSEWGALGYPITDELYGNKGGGAYQLFQNGRIYYTGTGKAYMIANTMIQEWNRLGAEWGSLGYPVMDTACGLSGNGCYQIFQNSITMYSTASTGTHTLSGGIRAKWGASGSEWGALGYPTSNELYGNKGGGAYQLFQNGSIYYTGSGKSYIIQNVIKDKWAQLNAEWGSLGYPTIDTVCGQKDGGCYQFFQDGTRIYWTPGTGAHTITGGIAAKWGSLGSEWGALGYPTSDEQPNPNGASQTFSHGQINWSSSTNTATVVYN